MQNNNKLLRKIIFTILLIPTFLLILIVGFTLIYGRQITEGVAKTAGNNFIKPIITPIIILSKIINNNDKNGLKTKKEDIKNNKEP
ncbi:MAG: hypothetical protein ABSF80_11125 [Chitinispirillaceae bacterium]|jgi:hypothetical protein